MRIDGEQGEVSLLDLLVVAAENLKLLILGPLVAGLLALGVAYVLPKRFTSQAILALPTPVPAATPTPTTAPAPAPAQAAAMMVSPTVLDPVIASLNLSGGQPIQVAREELASQVRAGVGKDGLLRLDVTADSAIEAQTIANAIIDTWLGSMVPGDQERADLEKRLAYAKAALDSVTHLIDRLAGEVPSNLGRPLTRGEAGTTMVAIGQLQAQYLEEALKLPRLLQGLSRDVVKQEPTLPTEPVAPRKGLLAAWAAMGGGIVMFLFVFARFAWRNASQDPLVAQKQAKVLAAMGIGTRSN